MILGGIKIPKQPPEQITPDENFLAHPKKGSPHSRGVAIDLTLINKKNYELNMGTEFDNFSSLSFHGNMIISKEAQKNRHVLLEIMLKSGWDFYQNEWWHYQLHNSKSYPLISNLQAPKPLL